ncbi:MAG: hypothetical protein IJD64_01840 [Clostridia bacterium]|nr:hypothetical protein [Clostridia bacterium]
MSENVKNIKKDKKTLFLAIGAILGVLLLLFGSFAGERREEGETGSEEVRDPEAYARAVEARVVEICSGVKGAGKVQAAVTLRGGYRAVYATDAKNSSSGYQSSTVLVGSGTSEEAILICYENPEIAGIGIVCEGGDDAEVRARIISLVSATFSIGTNKIFVASGDVS